MQTQRLVWLVARKQRVLGTVKGPQVYAVRAVEQKKVVEQLAEPHRLQRTEQQHKRLLLREARLVEPKYQKQLLRHQRLVAYPVLLLDKPYPP